jgi:hypothetical protein
VRTAVRRTDASTTPPWTPRRLVPSAPLSGCRAPRPGCRCGLAAGPTGPRDVRRWPARMQGRPAGRAAPYGTPASSATWSTRCNSLKTANPTSASPFSRPPVASAADAPLPHHQRWPTLSSPSWSLPCSSLVASKP